MSTIHRLPDVDGVEREASDWIARLNAEDVTGDDRAAFEAWRDAHPRHARAYEELSGTWHDFREAGRIVRAVSFGDAMNAVVNRGKRTYLWPALAAGIAVAGLVAVLMLRAPSATEFRTAVGEHVAVQLPDGSSLELNSDSEANVEYADRSRIIRLKRGEAFFKVHHDAQRPFWVAAGNSWVRAVGTAFNIRIRAADVRVVVSEGVVKVAADRGADETPSDAALAHMPVSILKAGQQADVRGAKADIRSLANAELTRMVAWREGVLDFDNQSLGAVIDELARYSDMQIVIANPELRQLPVGGAFKANRDGTEALLRMLEDGFGLDVRRDGDRRAYIDGEPRK